MSALNSRSDKFQTVVLLCGLFSMLLGGGVLIGWYTENAALIQVLPQFAPMQYNTALGFLFSGLAFTSLIASLHRPVPILFGLLTALLGLATLAQYVFHLDFGIDEFFMEAYITVKTSHPGRMAPNTALCFSLTGIVLFMLSVKKPGKLSVSATEIMALIILGLGFMAFIGYLTGVERGYSWANLTRMAIHTTIGFVILAAGILAYLWKREKKDIASIPLWIPIAVLTGIISIELYTPLGVAAGVLYVPLVFCSLWFNQNYTPFVFAAVASFLIFTGYFSSPHEGVEAHVILLNRGVAVMAVWITALIVFIQKRTAEKLKASEKRFQLAVDGTGEGLWDWPDIAKQDMQQYWSPRLYELLEYEDREIGSCYHTFLSLLHPEDLNQVNEAVQRHLEDDEPYIAEYRLKTKSGGYKWIRARGTKSENPDGSTRFTGSCMDITHNKEAEEEIMRSNLELERFAYIASHDLQEPLRMIINFTSLLEDEYDETLDDQGKEYMKYITDAAGRMQELVSDLLEYSRIGSEDSGFSSFDANESVDIVLANLKEQIEQTDASIHIDKLPVIYSNPIRFSRLMQNLVGNAIKYRHKDRTLEIRISVEEQDQQWLFSVSDNGIGIKEEYLKQIFVIFKRLHNKKEYQGTGIGLAVCQKIIETFGGKIWAESDPDQGSVFYFTIPKKEALGKAA